MGWSVSTAVCGGRGVSLDVLFRSGNGLMCSWCGFGSRKCKTASYLVDVRTKATDLADCCLAVWVGQLRTLTMPPDKVVAIENDTLA